MECKNSNRSFKTNCRIYARAVWKRHGSSKSHEIFWKLRSIIGLWQPYKKSFVRSKTLLLMSKMKNIPEVKNISRLLKIKLSWILPRQIQFYPPISYQNRWNNSKIWVFQNLAKKRECFFFSKPSKMVERKEFYVECNAIKYNQ